MKYFAILIFKLINWSVGLFWLLDILDMPFMEIFDTTIPLNGWFWFLYFVLIEIHVTWDEEIIDGVANKISNKISSK